MDLRFDDLLTVAAHNVCMSGCC